MCEVGWDKDDAKVACRQLGFSDKGKYYNEDLQDNDDVYNAMKEWSFVLEIAWGQALYREEFLVSTAMGEKESL